MSQSEATEGTRRSTRNPRRRQRPESDSLPTQPRRKRSKISEDTFNNPPDHVPNSTKLNGNGRAAAGHARRSSRNASTSFNAEREMDKAALGPAVSPAPSVSTTAELVVRGAKKTATKRAAKSDGSTVLAQNQHYSVRHLPSTPDVLKNSASDYRASILQSPPLALAITHERAYIWDYTSPTPVTHPRTFNVTQPSKPTDPLPIGALVTNSNTKAIGLLIVSSTDGKITYWENMDTAESLTLFQHRDTGIEGSLGSLFSGECVVDLTSADHAGFVITLSSGRIAQITLSDSQGKPHITTQFLRSHDASGSAGGIFGSIKNTFGLGAWKRDVVAVHTAPLGATREIQLVAATENAQVQVWHLSWAGQSLYRGSFDFRDMLQRELAHSASQAHAASSSALPVRDRPIRVLDMAITPQHARGDELTSSKTDAPLDLMLLVQSEDRPHLGPSYIIANVIMSASHARLERLIPIRPETAPSQPQKRPRLLIPSPGHTAYIVSNQQIIFASLTAPLDDSPEAQLMMESHTDANLFQDSLWMRSGKHFAIEACCEEDLADNRGASACALFVKGFGLARVAANEPTPIIRSRPTIKSKIEQAIFYGTMSDNIFDLSRKAKGSDQYDIDSVEDAALRISNEIISSVSPYLPAPTPIMATHLSSRNKACRALIMYLMDHYPAVSKSTSWSLMADAEKLAAAFAVWNVSDAKQSSATEIKMLPLCIKALDEDSKKKTASKGAQFKSSQHDSDVTRQWFISHVQDIGTLRTKVLHVIVQLYEAQRSNLMSIISDADDIIFSIYDTVFAFRAENAELYGFNYAVLAEGILEEGYRDLSEPWTSTHDTFNAFNRFIDAAREYSIHTYDHDGGNPYIQKVVPENVKLINILCLLYRERIAYITVHYGERGPQYPETFAEAFVASRAHHLRLLGKIGQDGAGIEVAEKYHDLETMVRLVIGQSEYLQGEMEDPVLTDVQRGLIQGKIDELEGHVQRYFKNLGEEWANAFFDAHLHNHHSYGLLLEAEKYREPLTKYLRAEKARGRVAWIHDVLQEHDFAEASKALSALAREQENKIWNKKIELSLGKLASLATQERNGSAGSEAIESQLQQQADDLTIVNIQEAIKASFEPILFAAVDVEAEVQMVSDAYAVMLKRKLPAIHNLIEIAFEDILKNIVLSPERLIDVLTLMDSRLADVPESDISGSEFYLALQVLQACKKDMEGEKFDVLHKLIWKRCWLSEDWEAINNTKRKSDKFISEQLRDSMICRTVALGLQNSLFAAGTGITPLGPTETLGAGCHREDIAYRFHVDDLIDPILGDNTTQDNELREMIETRRLEHWHGLVQEEAKKMIEEEMQVNEAEEAAARELSQTLANKEVKEGIFGGNGKVMHIDSDVRIEGRGEKGAEGSSQGDQDVEMS